MEARKGIISLLVLLLASVMALTGCADADDDAYWADWTEDAAATNGSQAATAGDNACESHEAEVEPGVCSYVVDCSDADTCEAWADRMVRDLEEWFGDLVYAEEWDVDEEESEREPDIIAAYSVEGDYIGLEPKSGDEEYYAWLWERFVWIIPSTHRQMISQFEVYDHADTMAYVIRDEEDYESWTYASNQIQATYETERIMTDIHEFGHLLSLNSGQVDPFISESECRSYMLDEGCAREDSYIHDFYRLFWEDGGSEDEDDYVTEYAMSDIYEDFAESWAYFVMTPRPAGDSVADRKVLFFYGYDDLIMLKAEILGRAASWLDRNAEHP